MGLKSALIHDWLVAPGGAERVLEELHALYPSPIFTLLYDKKWGNRFKEVRASFIQKLPYATRWYRNYLSLFPMAIEQLDVREFDLVISNSHAAAKGVLTHPHQLHVCYCLTPMRYAWDLYHDYLRPLAPPKRWAASRALQKIRQWDLANSSRVDHFIAISKYVARRVKKYYGREAEVIYPPVEIERFRVRERKEDFYLVVSRFVPYKRIDLIVEAFRHMPDKKLLVIGDGPEKKKIKAVAGKNVEFLGEQPDEVVADRMGRALAFLFAAEEDFGITPVEAQAAGTPVIAYGRGAILETVIPNQTGILFEEQTVDAVIEAVKQFEKWQEHFEAERIRRHAEQFSSQRFQLEFKRFVDKKCEDFYENRHPSGRNRDTPLACF